MKDRFAQSKKTLGSGMYGIVKETEAGTVIKKGTIGANEVEIQKRLAEVNGVPKVLGVEYSSDRDKDNEEREGIIEMEKANGRAIIDQTMKSDHAIKGDEASKVLDEYLRVRKDIHLRGVAHGDMHDANVTWDGKTMGLIDFGSSKVGYREALGEALGTRGVDHAKFFVDMLKKDGASSPKEQKFQANLAAVAKKSQGAELTEPQAKALIEELYNGI
jgi:tRNA A-37 threonylcarbamoyl transferase component Bud32